ncbi:Hsp70 family protein [Candidatus Pseudothioglobus sp. Uisw_041]|jgi:molecular chaperone DnaK|uniref:Hsp70 family protein n=1 Tax=Candidatus Pseudothioglobus sp. Uisw_041 TaxID=3230996 RepID=UPI003A84D962
MSAFIGIDLGTTYSAISTIDEHGIPKIINNSEGQNITPSCIWIKDDKQYLVGEEARKELGINKNVIARFKRDMGTKEKYTVRGQDFTPTDCSALVLKKLFQDAQKEVGDIGETVVTIPANFNNEARAETLKAAKEAGLNVKNIVDEPTAAALYYAFKGGVELKGHFAVFDLGGGTFDISLIKVDQQNINVLASEGVQKLGGDDFDTILQKIVRKKFKEEHEEVVDGQDYTKTDAEEDKKSLSKRDSLKVRFNKKRVSVTRAEFEEKISSLVMQTEMVCESILADQNLTATDLEAVFMVGGSTRIPLVQQAVERVFKQKPTQSVNVDEAVVLGASLYAAFKGDQSKLTKVQKASVNRIKVTDVCPSYFGTFYLGEDHQQLVSIIIEKNTPRPCSVTQSFYTTHEGQEGIDCSITSANTPETDPSFVRLLKDETLKLPAGRPANMEIQVTYSFDENGVMLASFLDVESGKKTDIKIGEIDASPAEKNKIDAFTVD